MESMESKTNDTGDMADAAGRVKVSAGAPIPFAKAAAGDQKLRLRLVQKDGIETLPFNEHYTAADAKLLKAFKALLVWLAQDAVL